MTENREFIRKLMTAGLMAGVALVTVAALVVLGSVAALFRASYGAAARVLSLGGGSGSDGLAPTSSTQSRVSQPPPAFNHLGRVRYER